MIEILGNEKAVVVREQIDRGIKLFYMVSGLIILTRTYEDLLCQLFNFQGSKLLFMCEV